jgi:hypothetical protein
LIFEWFNIIRRLGNKAIVSFRRALYQPPLTEKLAKETAKVEEKAAELERVLAAKRKLVEALEHARQLRLDIEAIGKPERKAPEVKEEARVVVMGRNRR